MLKWDLNPDLQASAPGLFHVGERDQYYPVPDRDVPLSQALSILRNHIIQAIITTTPISKYLSNTSGPDLLCLQHDLGRVCGDASDSGLTHTQEGVIRANKASQSCCVSWRNEGTN